MCFLLACSVLRIDVARAESALRLSADSDLSMRQFLCERGFFRVVDLEPDIWRDIGARRRGGAA